MQANIEWRGRMSFTANADSGFSVNLGADPAVGGDNDGLRPLELMAISLGGCTAMDVISILNKKRLDVTEFDVKIHVDRASDHPKVFTKAIIDYMVSGHQIPEDAVLRAIELSALRYCPAQAMLAKVFPIELQYYIYEDQGPEKKRILVKSGVCQLPQN